MGTELLKVVSDRARLIENRWLTGSDLVCLPQQVHQLREPLSQWLFGQVLVEDVGHPAQDALH